jgi:hypothetical protein
VAAVTTSEPDPAALARRALAVLRTVDEDRLRLGGYYASDFEDALVDLLVESGLCEVADNERLAVSPEGRELVARFAGSP